MKLHLPLRLLSSLLVVAGMASSVAVAADGATFTPTADLGTVMYVGDSITHGIASGSWRWPMHKILADNAVSYDAVGVMTGNSASYPSGLAAGTAYGNTTFNHLHSSEASARAYEIAGRDDGAKYGRFSYSNIQNWLGQSTELNKGKGTYTGATYTGEETPDTFFMLIGTNDLLSDGDNATNLSSRISTVTQNLLGDLDTIHASMRTARADAKLVVLSIPCWTTHSNGNSAETHQAVADYNASLKAWAEGKASEGVTLVDVNRGMIDVASATPFFGVSSMFRKPGTSNADGLHPNAQGDLIMAGNVAQQLGYAGRTAGQERMAASAFALQAGAIHAAADVSGTINLAGEDGSLSLESGASLSYNWAEGTDLSKGFTVDFALNGGLGDGSENGWATGNNLSITLGEGSFSGTLNIDEAYIKWGDSVLYSMDTSTLTTEADSTLRVSYINGNPLVGLNSGYYVWMGDMLIGEGLAGTDSASALNGLSVTNGSGATITLGHLSLDAQSWAPETTRFQNGNPLIASLAGSAVAGPGTLAWPTLGEDAQKNLSGAGVSTFRTASVSASGDVDITVKGNTTSVNTIYGNSGNYTGDVYVTLTGNQVRYATNGFNSAHNSGTLTGSVALRVDTGFVSSGKWVAFFGASNGTVSEDVYLEFSSAYLNANGGTYDVVNTSLAGSYKAHVGGDVRMVLNAGAFGSNVYGGEIGGNGYTIGGNVDIYLNEATVQGSVYGGGTKNSAINGNTGIHITGAATVGGSLITAGGTAGTIGGNATLEISNVAADSAFATSFRGALCGGTNVAGTSTLALSNVQALNATELSNFDSVVVSGGSELSLSSLGGAGSLSVVDSKLELTNTAGDAGTHYDMEVVGNAGGTITVKEGVSLSMKYAGDQQTAGTYVLEGGSLDFGGNATASSVVLRSGTLLGASGVAGDISVDMLTATQVSFSGDVSLAEACLALSADSMTAADAALLVAGDGKISITDSLTLNLDGELSQLVVEKLPGRTDAPMQLTMTGEEDPLAQSLLVANVRLDTGNAAITINLAEGYENYTVTATGIAYDEDGNSYVTYTVSSSQAVPEPATAALSLLALAGLAARRRRR